MVGNGGPCPLEDINVENGAGLLDGDGSAIHTLRRVAEVHIRQARLRKERHIHSHGHDAARQRSDHDGAVVVGLICDPIAKPVKDRFAAHVERPPAELWRNDRFTHG